MASPTDEHEVTCRRCFEFFAEPNIPKVLECTHTYCQVCLQCMVILNQPGEVITCPQSCEKKTPVPGGGVAALKTNLQLKNLAEQHPHYTKGPRSTAPKCVHHDEKTHLYCERCNELACQNCILAFHQGENHSSIDVKTTSKKWKQELNPVLDDTKTEIETCEASAQRFKNLKKEINKHLESEKQKVDQFVEEVAAKVKRKGEGIKNELQKTTETKLARIDEEVDRLEKQAKKLKAANEVATQTVASSDYAYITQHATLVNKMKKLLVKEKVPNISQTPHAAKFIQRKMPDVKPGRVVMPRELELVQEIGGFTGSYCLAYSPDGLLAVSDFNDPKVTVYHKQNGLYGKQTSLSLPDSNTCKPCGVAACADGKFLVARGTGIEVYASTGEYLKIILTTKDKSTSDVCSVVTMADGRILAGNTGRYVITKHDEPTGNIIQTMKTNIKPYHMTLIHDTHIAISDHNSSKASVIEMTSQRETLSIDVPHVRGICYDEQTECLLTVRSEPADESGRAQLNTGVIEQYCCTTGRLVACLVHGLYRPQGMALISDGNLAVADKESVKIYKIT